MQKKIRLKIAVIGPPKSGKTSFINNLLQKKFDINKAYVETQTYTLSLLKFVASHTDYQIQLWQCGSQHMSYNTHIRQAFFRNSSAALLMYDLSDQKNWKSRVEQWLTEAYQFDCFLVYAIGTKKDLYIKQKYEKKFGRDSYEEYLTDSILQSKGVETLDELDINKFFQQFQIKHFYQQANEPIHRQIRSIFINIQNDHQKLTRSSLAIARRFDNSIILDLKESKKYDLEQSVKLEEYQTEGFVGSEKTRKEDREPRFKDEKFKKDWQSKDFVNKNTNRY